MVTASSPRARWVILISTQSTSVSTVRLKPQAGLALSVLKGDVINGSSIRALSFLSTLLRRESIRICDGSVNSLQHAQLQIFRHKHAISRAM